MTLARQDAPAWAANVRAAAGVREYPGKALSGLACWLEIGLPLPNNFDLQRTGPSQGDPQAVRLEQLQKPSNIW